ncbi:OmpA family protein [Nodosilinea nodulosa]|uniref:OmpA family protein n=1 Tax=Nodosilinea nodulosa TaxID=416001 RepID=UPI0003083588|nr:OmpA family protein [Nodosilinea nodulosa]
MADSPNLSSPPPEPTPAPGGAGPDSPTPVSSASSAPSAKRRSPLGAGLHSLWTLVVRLIILGAGVSLGWLIGMLVAQVFPARSPEPPLTEVALRHSSQTLRKLGQLPQWWRGSGGIGLSPAEEAPPAASDSPGAAPAPAPDADNPPPLSDGDRDRITDDLASLRQDLASLSTRLKALETTLGEPPTGTVEDRLRRLDQRLETSGESNGEANSSPIPPEATGTEAPAAQNSAAQNSAVARYPEPRFPLVRDRVVLPSALLFEAGSSTLTAPGQQLLNTIVPDLRRYGVATLLVGSHTDTTTDPKLASQLTLQQALAVQQYLAQQLEGSRHRWVTVGYGNSRPLTAAPDPAAQGRNRRVEIGIVPGR